MRLPLATVGRAGRGLPTAGGRWGALSHALPGLPGTSAPPPAPGPFPR